MQILELGLIQSALRSLAAFLCKAIYRLIAWLYELFITISRVNILSSEEIAPIYQRITMVLTIVMVFYITFEFVKYVVQPDTINDKEKGVGNIALKMVVVILLIAFVPKIFTMAYDLQGRIIDTQFLSKVILGNNSVNTSMGDYGKKFSADVFSVFYKVNTDVCNGCDSEEVVNFNLNRLATVGDLKYIEMGLNESVKDTSPATNKKEEIATIDFSGLFAILVGGFMAYMLVLYCLDVGIRYFQLVFLQIMSPIAIMGYLSPKKDNMFSKWFKQCLTTYLDLFIRIIIIYFILLICTVLGDAYSTGKLFEGLGNISDNIKAFTYIFLLMGLLAFASKAPKMLKELFPSMGAAGFSYGPRTPKEVLNEAPYLGRALGGAYGMASGMLKNTRKSAGKAIDSFKEGKTKDGLKWLARGTVGNIGAGLSGLGLGVQSADPSGWKRASKNAYDRRQAKYKIQDAGYNMGSGRFWKDKARGVFMMDENVEDMSKASDLAMQSLQQQITAIQQKPDYNKNGHVISYSKANSKYILYNNSGEELSVGEKYTITDPTTGRSVEKWKFKDKNGHEISVEDDVMKVAELTKALGKESAKNKALHQKENEAKDKK